MSFPPLRIALVGAHPDDVALSMGGLAHRLHRASMTLITCFSASCATGVDDAGETTRTRGAEDEAYARHLHAALVRLGFADTSIRTRRGAIAASPDADVQLRRDLAARLALAIRDVDADVLFAPLAVGAHADHVHCLHAIRQLPASPAVLFYEDLPYAQFAGGPCPVHETIRATFPELCPRMVRLTAGDMLAKHRALDFYQSQIHPQWRRDVDRYAQQLGAGGHAERVWLSPQSQHRFVADSGNAAVRHIVDLLSAP